MACLDEFLPKRREMAVRRKIRVPLSLRNCFLLRMNLRLS